MYVNDEFSGPPYPFMHPFFDPTHGALQTDLVSLLQESSWASCSSHLARVLATDRVASCLLRDFFFLQQLNGRDIKSAPGPLKISTQIVQYYCTGEKKKQQTIATKA
jgi:hypothetical protein